MRNWDSISPKAHNRIQKSFQTGMTFYINGYISIVNYGKYCLLDFFLFVIMKCNIWRKRIEN